MNRRGLSAAALVIGLMLIPNCDLAFAADRRVALVIGNSSYQNAPILANPTKDAEAMAESFKVAGFDVVTALYNLGIRSSLLSFAGLRTRRPMLISPSSTMPAMASRLPAITS